MSDLMLDVDQAGELKAAFRRGDWNNSEIKQLSSGDMLAKVRDVVRGLAEIKPIEHIIDFGADPFLPDGLSVEEHQKGKVAKLERKGDDLYLDDKKIEFWVSSEQKRGVITGHIVRAKLKGKSVLNANLLDHLLKHSHLIPEAWKKDENGNTRYIFFWGTIYRRADGRLYVRYLYWNGGRWLWFCYWLDDGFDDINPAAVSAS